MFVKVKSVDIKRAFSDISTLGCDTVAFTTENRKLVISSGTTILYENILDCTEISDYTETVINVQYLDLTDLLGDKDDVKLTFTQYSVELSYRTLEVSLNMSDTVIQRPTNTDTPNALTNASALQLAVGLFKSLGVFQKTLQMERPLQIFGDYGLLQFPTVWVRVRSSDLRTVLTREQALVIGKFKPESYSETNVITLYRDTAKMVIPIVPVPDGDEFVTLVSTMTSYGTKTTKGLLARVKRLSTTLGVCDCDVYIGESTLHFAVRKNNMSIVDKSDDVIQNSFTTRLEYLVAFFAMLGSDSDIEVLMNDNGNVCLRNANVSIIMSTGR